MNEITLVVAAMQNIPAPAEPAQVVHFTFENTGVPYNPDWIEATTRLPVVTQIKYNNRAIQKIKRQKWRNKGRNRR